MDFQPLQGEEGNLISLGYVIRLMCVLALFISFSECVHCYILLQEVNFILSSLNKKC